ncbi:MAG: DNA-3-methyladenine glycosylase [Bacteroidota bacterium]
MIAGLTKLPRSFYLRPTLQVAKDLLGKYLVRNVKGKRLVGKIVEVEAYGQSDPASHSYRGMTERNKVMFDEGGHLYVYFTYGVHFCANVVTREEGVGEAVLIRALEPIEGIEEMRRNRGSTGNDGNHGNLANLTNGPAKMCQAFGIDKKLNGADLTGDEIYIANGEPIRKINIGITTRVGIVNGRDKKWRCYVEGSRFVSKAKTRT